MNRNRFITYSAAYASAAAMLPRRALSASESSYAVLDRIVPTETDADRIAQITFCLRPFRAQGPRVEAEHVGDKLVVHTWTPDSRVALESDTTAAFANTWERMARTSFAPELSRCRGTPVEWNDRYIFSRSPTTTSLHFPKNRITTVLSITATVLRTSRQVGTTFERTMGTPLGMIAWLIPQDGVNYGFGLDGLAVLGRRDGTVQPNLQGADTGWNDDNEAPDRAAAVAGVAQVRALFEGAGYAADRSIHH